MNRLQSLLGQSRSAWDGGLGWDGLTSAVFNGAQFPFLGLNQTIGNKIEDIDLGYTSLVYRAYASNAVVFACMRARRELFTEARFGFQDMRGGLPGDFADGRDGRNPATGETALLEHPWPGATTGDLLKYLITDNDLAGNAFVARRPGRLVRLRPDWTQIIHASPNPDGNMWDLDAELVGYAYQPGGRALGRPWVFLQPTEVAHFSTTPDPLLPIRGMSWLTPIIREVMADEAMTEHRLKYFENGGTPNLVVKTQYTDVNKLNEFMNFLKQNHAGVTNAYKMMGFTAGVDATVVGSDLKQLDFKEVQAGGETRISAAAGVPAVLAGLSEGIRGSSLNAGQGFSASMRLFADITMSPAWRNAAGSLEQIIRRPTGFRLWYDIRGIPALKDDIKSAAEVRALDATAFRTLSDGGWDADSIVDAITANDWKHLKGKHTGVSVQLQAGAESGTPAPAAPPTPPEPKRDELLLHLLDVSERRALQRTEPVINVPVTVNTPEQPVTFAFERGMFEGAAPVTVEPAVVNVSVEPTPVEIRNEPAVVNVTNDLPPLTVINEVAPTPVEVRNEIAVEPTPVSINAPEVTVVNEVPTPSVTVEAPTVNVTNEVASPEVTVEAPTVNVHVPEPKPLKRTIKRNAKGAITGIEDE